MSVRNQRRGRAAVVVATTAAAGAALSWWDRHWADASRHEPPPPRRRWWRFLVDDASPHGWWVAALVAVVTLATRLPLLGYPKVLVFDEIFYAPDALDLLQWGAERGRAVHPPGGKWLIAGGIRLFGFTPFGWRFASLVAGVLVAALTADLVRRLTRRRVVGLCAGLLVCFDGIMFTTGRLALLDAFAALFVVLSVWFLALAWRSPPARRRVRWLGIGALEALSLAGTVKWSGLWIGPAVVLPLLVLDWRQCVRGRRRRRALALTVALSLALPLANYLLVYVPREVGSAPLSPRAWWDNQVDIAQFHLDLRPTNTYAASGTTWLFQTHPVALYRETCTPGMASSPVDVCPRSGTQTQARILAVANPVSWTVGVLGVVAVVVLIAWRRDGAALWLLAAAASQWLPWVLNPRAAYSFYEATLVPLLVACFAYAVGSRKRRWWELAAVLATFGSLAMFIFLYPVLTGLPLTHAAADARLLGPGWP